MITIDKNVPMPMKARFRDFIGAHWLESMVVGDSFNLSLHANGEFYRRDANIRAAFKRRGWKVASKRNNETKTIRYWRVA